MGRWLWNNVGTLALSVLLAILVWVVALNQEDPIQENEFPEQVPIELVNTPPDLIPIGLVTTQATVSLSAPKSVWETLTSEKIHLFANLAGLAPNTYEIPLSWSLDDPNVQVTEVTPRSINITLESRATRELPVRVEVVGEPALGYEMGVATPSVLTTTVTGPASAVDRVSEIRVSVSLAGLKNDVDVEAALIPVDSSGKPVSQVELNPLTTQVRVPITQKRGFRDVAVKVVITGQVASGYWVTNITVAPPIITVVSANPLRVSDLPGFVETQPLDITEANNDIAERLLLALPEGVSPVGVQSVLVQVNIAAIEGSLTVQRLLEIQGLSPGLSAFPSPDAVDVLLSGPLPVLDRLTQDDVRVILDLTGLEIGTHQITPEVSLLPDELRDALVLPGQVEVVITRGVTPSRTPTPTLTPTLTPTPRPTLRPTFTPSVTPTITATLSITETETLTALPP